jgi:hypothetical protein
MDGTGSGPGTCCLWTFLDLGHVVMLAKYQQGQGAGKVQDLAKNDVLVK